MAKSPWTRVTRIDQGVADHGEVLKGGAAAVVPLLQVVGFFRFEFVPYGVTQSAVIVFGWPSVKKTMTFNAAGSLAIAGSARA